MTRTEFLLTISTQYQAVDENVEKCKFEDFLVDPVPNLRTSITGIIWQTVTRITNAILSVEGLGIQDTFRYNIFQKLYLAES